MKALRGGAILVAAFVTPSFAQHAFYACMTVTKQYVVGAKLPPSGLFRRTSEAEWLHAGYNHPFVVALDYDFADPSTIYAAAGNGLIRASDHGKNWTILTGSDVTELRDVSVDPHAPGTIYFAHSAGIRVTHDGGATWKELSSGLHRKYTEALRVDREHAGVLLAGGEEGIFRSENAGVAWKPAGAAGFQIMHIEQSPFDACYWLATTQQGGLFASHDCGVTFENSGDLGVGRNLYDIAFDPGDARRIAVAGVGFGVAISQDAGSTWQFRNAGLPRIDVSSIAFDPDRKGRIYAGVHEEALYVSDDAGATWRKDGLDGSAVSRMKFVPDGPAR